MERISMMKQLPVQISERLQKSIRSLQISIFKNIIKRPASILSQKKDLHQSVHLNYLNQPHNQSFIATMSFKSNKQTIYMSVVSISLTTFISVILEETPFQTFQNPKEIYIINRKSKIVIEKLSRISVKEIYPSLGYDLLIIFVKQPTQIKSIGYNFSPFRYRQKRTQLLRINDQIKKQGPKFIFELKTQAIIKLPNLYPYLDLERNWMMEDASLLQIYTGSPVLERVGEELYLIGFYCKKCEIPAQDNHKMLIFNTKILEKIQITTEKKAGQKVSLSNYTFIYTLQ